MPKRSFWTVVGYSAGVASTMALRRRVRRAVTRYSPAEVGRNISARGADVVDRARQFTIDLRSAAHDGRRAMRDSEAELDAEFSLPRNHTPRR